MLLKKLLDSLFINSERNLLISSSIFRISASNRSLMLLNSVSMTLKSPSLMGMSRLRDMSPSITIFNTEYHFSHRTSLHKLTLCLGTGLCARSTALVLNIARRTWGACATDQGAVSAVNGSKIREVPYAAYDCTRRFCKEMMMI